MRNNLSACIREMLRAAPDGLTTREIADALGVTSDQVHRRLRNMPDAYKDRWTKVSTGIAWAAVYCVVVPPPDCPRPERTK